MCDGPRSLNVLIRTSGKRGHEGRSQKREGCGKGMAEDTPSAAWKEAEALLAKGKSAGVLEVLREVDPGGEHGTTLRLAGQALHMQASKSGSKREFRKSAKLLLDAVQKNPRDKAANSAYNQLRNEMQERSISERVIPPDHLSRLELDSKLR